MNDSNEQLDALKDIRQMMQRSSRFISLSGLSGIAAGCWALIGAYFAYDWIYEYYVNYNTTGTFTGNSFSHLKINLVLLACFIFIMALISALFFTWRKARKDGLPVWDHASKNLLVNIGVPIVAGALFILTMLQYDIWLFVAPACLIFYGLALVNASKFTFSDIRYLGFILIALGLINTQFIGYGLYFWAFGFGVLHIIYGVIMWLKYESAAQ